MLARILSLEDYEVRKAENAKKGLEYLKNEDFDLVITDVKLPDGNGVELVKSIKAKAPLTEIILLTAFGKIQDGVEAMRNGAFDYLVKGDNHEQMLLVVPKAIDKAILQKKVALLEKKMKKVISFDDMIGKNKSFSEAIEIARKSAPTDASILILGETGTGKEVFAEAIHQESLRAYYPFVVLNCAAIPKDLLESELFGHKKGAFTGAVYDKKGLLEEANKGTLFLDELGEMNIDLQAKILRVLDTKSFTKVGDTKPQFADVRIVAATNRDLEMQIRKENFRADLFYRLSVISIHLPALRDRKDDLEMLIKYFVAKFSQKMNKPAPEIQKSFMDALKQYHFPGNIRELRNLIERALILNNDNILTIQNLPQEILTVNNFDYVNQASAEISLANIEKLHIQKILELANGNKTKAARDLGIGLTTLYRKIQEYGLE